MHLFFHCSFSETCWLVLNIVWDTSLPPLDMILHAHHVFGRSIFGETIMVASWCI
ncbi:hypothetical protein HU200_002386 [Digitaria exilis]|uniref:Uncharacterized protein n=1 Tax=Digitaria exilis TaxID=1010633 RepID=A0A835FVK1_9POAL|nr:hypothetical protein HU200_002386 [Digitaria exilis]